MKEIIEVLRNKGIMKHIKTSYLWTTVAGRGFVDVGHLETISEKSRPHFTLIQSTLALKHVQIHL